MKTNRFTEGFKRSLVILHKEARTSLRALQATYGVSSSALSRWIRQYTEVSGSMMT